MVEVRGRASNEASRTTRWSHHHLGVIVGKLYQIMLFAKRLIEPTEARGEVHVRLRFRMFSVGRRAVASHREAFFVQLPAMLMPLSHAWRRSGPGVTVQIMVHPYCASEMISPVSTRVVLCAVILAFVMWRC